MSSTVERFTFICHECPGQPELRMGNGRFGAFVMEVGDIFTIAEDERWVKRSEDGDLGHFQFPHQIRRRSVTMTYWGLHVTYELEQYLPGSRPR